MTMYLTDTTYRQCGGLNEHGPHKLIGSIIGVVALLEYGYDLVGRNVSHGVGGF